MSGGHLDYLHGKLNMFVDDLNYDETYNAEFPDLTPVLAGLLDQISTTEKEMDWHVSCDHRITDLQLFQEERLLHLFLLCAKELPDRLFPRGKWAMIQEFKRRAESFTLNPYYDEK